MLPYTSSNLPGNSDGQPSDVPLFGLAPDGVYQAFPVTRKTGALLPHRFTLTCPTIAMDGQAVFFLLHFPSRHRDSTLWSVLSCGVRTFLQAGSPLPSDRLVRSDRNIFVLNLRLFFHIVKNSAALGARNQFISPLNLNIHLGRHIHETSHADPVADLADSRPVIHL